MNHQIYICGCEQGGKISPETVTTLRNQLEQQNKDYIYIQDMCGSIPKNPQDMISIKDSEKSVIIGCQPRAMECLLDYAIFCTCGSKIDYYHADTVLENEDLLTNLKTERGTVSTIEYKEDWKPWYPVIDYSRCTSCQKCLNFCLFGVYEKGDDGKVLVTNPSNCKDLCPACARACPDLAIIFPKHHESTIDGQSDIISGQSEDSIIDKIQNEDVYKVLSQRRKAFKTPLLKTDQLKIAEEERRSCCSTEKDSDCCTDEDQNTEAGKNTCCEDTNESDGNSCCC
jgi:Pyruvate/2-oxoacid:ferredoxin oxidoreductase delta subunit